MLPQVVLLECAWCGAQRAPDLDPWCGACGGSLRLATGPRAVGTPLDAVLAGIGPLSLGEGATPLLPLRRLYPGGTVLGKAEWMNPTGSFKDRGAAAAMGVASALGAPGVVVASTGNNAASVSAYAARAGLPCMVILPAATPRGKVVQALAHGATVVRHRGDFSDSYRLAESVRLEAGWANLTSTYLNPYMTTAHGAIAREILAAMGGELGTVLVPIGAGPMLEGIAVELDRARGGGLIGRLPLVIGVQAAGCAPIARAFDLNAEQVDEWPHPPVGIANSINDPLRGYSSDGTRTLGILRRHGGVAIAVTDTEIEAAMVDLGTMEGMAVEPAAAATLAAFRTLDARRLIRRPAVIVLSGHALKDPDHQPLANREDTAFTDVDVVALARSRVGRPRSAAHGGTADAT